MHAADAVFVVFGIFLLGYVMGRWTERRHAKRVISALTRATSRPVSQVTESVRPHMERLERATSAAPSVGSLTLNGASHHR